MVRRVVAYPKLRYNASPRTILIRPEAGSAAVVSNKGTRNFIRMEFQEAAAGEEAACARRATRVAFTPAMYSRVSG